jgi:phage-related protein
LGKKINTIVIRLKRQNVMGYRYNIFKTQRIIFSVEWQLIFYKDKKGNEPVKDYILKQPDKAIAEILHVFKLLREFNISLGMPYVRKIEKSGLRELRIKHGSDIYRIFYYACGENKFKLLHAIIKKGDKISLADKELALQRMNTNK